MRPVRFGHVIRRHDRAGGIGELDGGASPVVRELQRHVEVELAELLDHRLQFVLVLGRDPQLVTLGAHLGLRVLGSYPFGEVAGELFTDALTQLDDLPYVAFGSGLGFLRIEDLESMPRRCALLCSTSMIALSCVSVPLNSVIVSPSSVISTVTPLKS